MAQRGVDVLQRAHLVRNNGQGARSTAAAAGIIIETGVNLNGDHAGPSRNTVEGVGVAACRDAGDPRTMAAQGTAVVPAGGVVHICFGRAGASLNPLATRVKTGETGRAASVGETRASITRPPKKG